MEKYNCKDIAGCLDDENIVERQVEAWEFSSKGVGVYRKISIGV